jgi:hypothetical protein
MCCSWRARLSDVLQLHKEDVQRSQIQPIAIKTAPLPKFCIGCEDGKWTECNLQHG